VVYSATFTPRVGLDASARLILTSSDRLNSFGVLSTAFTVGVRLRSDAWRFELHPELAVLVDDLTQEFTHVYPAGAAAEPLWFGQSLTLGVSLGVTFLP
jgi:hypothetical protein